MADRFASSRTKNFTSDQVVNRRNTRYLSAASSADTSPEVKFSMQSKHPASMMMLSVITSDGRKRPPIFIEAGNKVNAAGYQQLLQDKIMPWLRQEFSDNDCVAAGWCSSSHCMGHTEFPSNSYASFWPKTICGHRPVRILILWIILFGSVWRVSVQQC